VTGESPKAADQESGKGFFDELLAAPQRRLEALQRSIDERIKSSVGRITSHPVVQHEVQRIERSIKKLEERLARLRREEGDSPRGGNAVG
jgi:polyhydroxyalkanoate synthesis regulator phasin